MHTNWAFEPLHYIVGKVSLSPAYYQLYEPSLITVNIKIHSNYYFSAYSYRNRVVHYSSRSRIRVRGSHFKHIGTQIRILEKNIFANASKYLKQEI